MPTFSGILALALGSGLNLYATALTLGLAVRFGWVHGLPPELNILGQPLILGIAATMYVMEFVADKIPFVTPFWDAIHTFIRPLGAALLASQAAAQLDPMARTAAVLLSGSVALAAHSGKMGARLAAHTIPDPVTHSGISIAEDIGVIGLLLLAWTHPLIALPLMAILVLILVVVLRFVYRTLKALPGRMRQRFALRRNGVA